MPQHATRCHWAIGATSYRFQSPDKQFVAFEQPLSQRQRVHEFIVGASKLSNEVCAR
jgi:hypothetical protein